MTTLLLWSPAYWVHKQNCCFLVTGAVCRPSWGLCRGLGYLLEKELESSSTKHQILHLLAVWNSGSGNWWRIETWDLLNWDRTLKSALHSSQRALLRRLLLLTLQKICCFLPYHICAVMDHTRSLEGIPESHGYLHHVLEEMRLELFYSLTLRFQSTFFPSEDGRSPSPHPSSSYNCSLFLHEVLGLEQKQMLPILTFKPNN